MDYVAIWGLLVLLAVSCGWLVVASRPECPCRDDDIDLCECLLDDDEGFGHFQVDGGRMTGTPLDVLGERRER